MQEVLLAALSRKPLRRYIVYRILLDHMIREEVGRKGSRLMDPQEHAREAMRRGGAGAEGGHLGLGDAGLHPHQPAPARPPPTSYAEQARLRQQRRHLV